MKSEFSDTRGSLGTVLEMLYDKSEDGIMYHNYPKYLGPVVQNL